ncbi:MAG: hypothetical protein M3Y42_14125 [Actinomycetota bacterium]|nr:hypothetical protein [Actinomycetota bacterium]
MRPRTLDSHLAEFEANAGRARRTSHGHVTKDDRGLLALVASLAPLATLAGAGGSKAATPASLLPG